MTSRTNSDENSKARNDKQTCKAEGGGHFSKVGVYDYRKRQLEFSISTLQVHNSLLEITLALHLEYMVKVRAPTHMMCKSHESQSIFCKRKERCTRSNLQVKPPAPSIRAGSMCNLHEIEHSRAKTSASSALSG
jgi:hypothetical protein